MNDSTDLLTVAVATIDGESMPKSHFGEAPRFDLYRLDGGPARFLKSVSNPMSERAGDHRDHKHAPGEHTGHAAGIGRMLAMHGAEVMVSRAFGANIQRMRQRFLPILVHREQVAEALSLVGQHWPRVLEHWRQGENRKHLVLR